MPRKPRIFVAGGTYHVYCRVARGERPFVNEAVAVTFVSTVEVVNIGTPYRFPRIVACSETSTDGMNRSLSRIAA